MQSKELKRERRKIDNARRHRVHRKPAAAALGAAAAIAAGTQAYAAPIRFDNPPGPGHFNWYDGAGDSELTLDIVLPAISQTGIGGSLSGLRQALTPALTNLDGMVRSEIGGYLDLFAIDVPAMTLIPSGAPFSNGIQAYAYYPGFGSEIPAGVAAYIGLRFNLGSGDQFGWVGVTRNGAILDAFAWGYETTPGVPIAAGVPEPGSLALLAFGAVGLVTKRRRTA